MGRSRCFLTNAFGAHILVWNISCVIKIYVECGTNMGCKHQNEIKTHPSLLTLSKEQAGHYRASLLPEARVVNTWISFSQILTATLQLLQPGYRAPHPLWQLRAGNTEVMLPFCHFKGVPNWQHTTLLATSLLSNHEGKKTSMIQNFKLLPSSLSSPRTLWNVLVGRLIWGSSRKDVRGNKISVPSRIVTLSMTVYYLNQHSCLFKMALFYLIWFYWTTSTASHHGTGDKFTTYLQLLIFKMACSSRTRENGFKLRVHLD